MKPDLLASAGAALWGYGWKYELARTLGVSPRTVLRWCSGETRTPVGLATELYHLSQMRRADITRVQRKLRSAARGN